MAWLDLVGEKKSEAESGPHFELALEDQSYLTICGTRKPIYHTVFVQDAISNTACNYISLLCILYSSLSLSLFPTRFHSIFTLAIEHSTI